MNDPLIYIIVLNFNGLNHLEYCLPSISKTIYSNHKIILVDNCSTDESVEYVKKSFPNITLLQADKNHGWAGGNNIGIKHAIEHNAEYVVLANNDIVVHPMWLEGAKSAFISDPKIGFVGCNVFGCLKPMPIEEYEKAAKEWKEIKFDYTDEYVDGLALFTKIDVFKNLGMIDEVFFVYGEETDLEIRAKKAGYLRAKTNVPIWHYSSGAFEKTKIKAAYLGIRNNIRVSIKHDPILGILRTIRNMYLIGCNPFYKADMEDKTIARIRPKGMLFNFALISYCLYWNLIHLNETLRRKRVDYELINKTLTTWTKT
jgi:GT2 family glycosyltransferase